MSEQNPPQSISGIFPFPIPCEHQFFEVRDISYSPLDTQTINGKEQMVMLPHRGGKQVMCALCGEMRQLWDTGEILVHVEGYKWKSLKKKES